MTVILQWFKLYLLLPANEVCEGYVFTGVCLSTGGGMRGCSRGWGDVRGCSWEGACMVARGHAWLLWGGMHGCSRGDGGHAWLCWGGMRGCSRGACMVALGGMCGCSRGGHAWLLQGGHAWLLWGGACVVFSMRYGQ